jgi:hypothetical protein
MDHDKEVLLINATRYCLGRMSYAVGEHCDILRRSWPYLTTEAKQVIIRDIETYLTNGSEPYVPPVDRDWEFLAKALWR